MKSRNLLLLTFAIVCGTAPAASQTGVPSECERPDTTVLVFRMNNGDSATFYLQRTKNEKKCREWCVQGMVRLHADDGKMAYDPVIGEFVGPTFFLQAV